MYQTVRLDDIPDVVLLIGTDAAGKDHVANILVKMITEAGGKAEKRQRFFSGSVTHAASSEHKSRFDTFQEKVFLRLFPSLGVTLPYAAALATRWDLFRFKKPKRDKLVVVGHNGLRALAFYLGNTFVSERDITIPAYVENSLRLIREKTGAHILVLDVEDHIRQKRIAARIEVGAEDTFDRYMKSDSIRSEHIEACLVHLVTEKCDGVLLENNDLTEDELSIKMLKSFF